MDDKKESPLTRSIAVPQPSPPVKEKPSDIQCNTVLTPDNKAQHRRTTNHKENTATRTPTSPNKAPSSPAGKKTYNLCGYAFLNCSQMTLTFVYMNKSKTVYNLPILQVLPFQLFVNKT